MHDKGMSGDVLTFAVDDSEFVIDLRQQPIVLMLLRGQSSDELLDTFAREREALLTRMSPIFVVCDFTELENITIGHRRKMAVDAPGMDENGQCPYLGLAVVVQRAWQRTAARLYFKTQKTPYECAVHATRGAALAWARGMLHDLQQAA